MTVTVPKVEPKELRDEIAIEALRELIALQAAVVSLPGFDLQLDFVNSTTRMAYRYADAMLAERRKLKGDSDVSTARPEAKP